MKLSDFDFDLPADRIAQRPAPRRDESRLMLLDRRDGRTAHREFHQLVEVVRPGDLLVLNDTRVLAARLLGRKPTGGRIELLLLERREQSGASETWSCWTRSSRGIRPGLRVELAGGLLATLLERDMHGWVVRLEVREGSVAQAVEKIGRVPLPPYVERGEDEASDPQDRERYQTVYARRDGAVAAPTAGLHFTPDLLGRLEGSGARLARLTLHVGPGTFQPVRVERVEDHRMHEEAFELPPATVEALRETRARGGRVIAVGTTVVRTLESRVAEDGIPAAGRGRCDLFIYPGFRFRVVDAMITNFHLPRSTLLMLVAAFAGRERVLAAYREAIEQRYRFYSYGDAMFVGDTG